MSVSTQRLSGAIRRLRQNENPIALAAGQPDCCQQYQQYSSTQSVSYIQITTLIPTFEKCAVLMGDSLRNHVGLLTIMLI